MSPEDITPSEKSQSQKDNIVWFLKIILYDSSCRRSLEESNPQRQKVEWWLPGAGGEGGMENWCLMGIEFQFYKMMTAMLMNGADGCAALWVYLISLNYILKLVKMMNFMLCIFYIFFNWKNFFLVKILFLGQSLKVVSLQQAQEFQDIIYVRQICSCCPGGETFLVLSTLPSLPNPPTRIL